MAASFPDACLQAKPFLNSLLNNTEKSERIFKTKVSLKCTGITACLLKLEARKHVGQRYWKANRRLSSLTRKTVARHLKDMDRYICLSISIPVENHIFISIIPQLDTRLRW